MVGRSMYISQGAIRKLKEKVSMTPFNTVMDLQEDILNRLNECL
jgi:hypothetical protein